MRERFEPATTEPDRLRLSRRLDWRFLMADPALRAVGYIGQHAGSLLPALQQFSDSVTVIKSQSLADGDHAGRFDVAVLSGPSRSLLQNAVPLLRPGGWLYAEISRLRSPSHPSRYAAAASSAGLQHVQLHWHWTSFEACTKIIPLGDATALSYLARRRGVVPEHTRAAAARRLLESGLLGWTVSCFSVVGTRL